MALTTDSRATTGGSRRRRSTTLTGIFAKVLGLGVVAALVVWAAPVLIATDRWFGLGTLLAGAALIVVVYGTQRFVPAKYLLPGTLFLVAMVVYPIVQTFQLSFTNFGDGKRVSKDEAVASIIGSSVQQVPDSTLYNMTVGTTGSVTEGPFTFLPGPARDR